MASATVYGDDGEEVVSFEIPHTASSSPSATLSMIISQANTTGYGNSFNKLPSSITPNVGINTFQPFTPNPLIGPGLGNVDPFDWQKDTCLAGHNISADLIEYIDGEIVSYCSVCRCRVKLQRVPGGVSLIKIKELLGAVMGLDDETVQCPEFNLSAILGLFASLREELEETEFQVRQARKLIDLAGEVLNTKVIPK